MNILKNKSLFFASHAVVFFVVLLFQPINIAISAMFGLTFVMIVGMTLYSMFRKNEMHEDDWRV